MKTVLPLLLLLVLLATRPAAAQTLAAPATADSLELRVAAYTNYLTDAVRLSPRQRRQVAALLTEQLRHPGQPLPPVAWMQVLCLQQYQLWQATSETLPGLGPLPLQPRVLLASRPE